MSKPLAVVVGIGPGNGEALARRFSKAGYQLALLSRSTDLSSKLAAELGDARAIACDAGDPASVERAFEEVRTLGTVETLLYNAGSGAWGSVEDITPQEFENNWRVNALGTLTSAQQVVGPMKAAGKGNIVLIGATASRRGAAGTAAFAPAKAAQRSLAESMAKHLGPAGIHVALIIIDGVVDLPRTRKRMPDKPSDFFVKPDAVAETAFQLTRQDRSAWSFEVEARPFGEKW
ncbi:MAG: SDR family NAD(P)-dependent oxidoreductase [Myxococcales bacterium]|nr:SDR family NAD(P)-dependent oxidoreductase [Myxococcales bacterium]MCB9575727.1 SDR family NAD(P)-dependent oxidoreductase [Polyangiaceae bacterium]